MLVGLVIEHPHPCTIHWKPIMTHSIGKARQKHSYAFNVYHKKKVSKDKLANPILVNTSFVFVPHHISYT